jgi:hypothetical protein
LVLQIKSIKKEKELNIILGKICSILNRWDYSASSSSIIFNDILLNNLHISKLSNIFADFIASLKSYNAKF